MEENVGDGGAVLIDGEEHAARVNIHGFQHAVARAAGVGWWGGGEEWSATYNEENFIRNTPSDERLRGMEAERCDGLKWGW